MVLQAAILSLEGQKPGMFDRSTDPIKWLREKLQVQCDEDSSLISISVPGAPYADQPMIANEVAFAYMRTTAKQGRPWQTSRIKKLEGIYNDECRRLAEVRKSLRESTESDPERLAALRDSIAIREEISRRIGIAVEEMRLELVVQLKFQGDIAVVDIAR